MSPKLVGRVLASSIVVGLVVACSVNVDVANKGCPCGTGYVCDTARNVCVPPELLSTNNPPPPACDPCTCAVDGDCKDPTRAHCSPGKICVECSQTPDSCTVGYCNDKFQCTAGCKNEADCQAISPGTHCDLKRHQCVECVPGGAPCGGGQTCSPSGTCVQACSLPSNPCAGGKECCGGFCLDTKSDVLNCGACGVVCSTQNGTPACAIGVCKWSCASGFAHCGPVEANTGCETNTRTDPAHCGSCTTPCNLQHANGVACSAGQCSYTTCQPFFDNCDNNRANGCECSCGDKSGDCCKSGQPCKNGGCNGVGRCPQ